MVSNMAVGTDGGLVNPAEGQSFVIGEAISVAGALVKLANTGKMVLCDAGEEPDGYMLTDTKDRVTEVALANVPRGVGALVEGNFFFLLQTMGATDRARVRYKRGGVS